MGLSPLANNWEEGRRGRLVDIPILVGEGTGGLMTILTSFFLKKPTINMKKSYATIYDIYTVKYVRPAGYIKQCTL